MSNRCANDLQGISEFFAVKFLIQRKSQRQIPTAKKVDGLHGRRDGMQVSALHGGLRFYRSRVGGFAEGKLLESGLHDGDGSDAVLSGNSP